MKINLEGTLNTRDLGGQITKDGYTIKKSSLIRSDAPSKITFNDIQILKDHGLALDIDLRTTSEAGEKPDPAIDGVTYLHLPVFKEQAAGITREEKAMKDIMQMMIEISEEKASQNMMNLYRSLIEDPYSRSQYETFLNAVLDCDGAVLWHCTAGKDRAGFATIIVEEALGLDRKIIYDNYMRTTENLKPEIERIRSLVQKRGLVMKDEAALNVFFGTRPEFFETIYQTVENNFGSFDQFIEEGLHFGEDKLERFKKKYLIGY